MLYHITPDGPKRCVASIGSCKYSSSGSNHFDTVAEAQAVYESDLSKKYGVIGQRIAKKVSNHPLQKFYHMSDELQKSSPVVRSYYKMKANRTYAPSRRSPSHNTRRRVASSRKRQNFLQRSAKKFVRKNVSKFKRALTPNARNVKKMLMMKYWFPDIHSNKWK